MAAISINNITKMYGGESPVKALQNINFEVNHGELFGLIGPDGAGKTSLFRILATLLLPDKGSASIENLDVVNHYREIRNILSYMPGKFSLYQDLTIKENLEFFAGLFGTTLDANYEFIKDIYVQIEPFKNRRAGQLSGGMKQKLALCCSLIHKPSILLLDEPTTGVDPVSRKEFWEMLRTLRNQNITTLVSTPYMDEANMCDRIALIQNGQIMSINTPSGILDQFPYRLFAIKSNNNYHLLQKLKDNSEIRSCYIFGEYLHITFQDNRPIEIHGTEMMEIKPGIEDCFIELMDNGSNNN
ncbi:ABC transporter ATP-binding protein [Dysgonomonas macrotermitis]|uniref:ABC-type multidrug transport system, ATPase component n=1 Tax=Dysgonomonas macrotermitis TaxID=1346286 RepID=A0A1M4SV72_9BACT|nr:ABC transporter ATP-binding protein [Dysgonomonas macrotermitis]SHE36100.1 ABC-type multidrug transport system, ATPase component [Dysgonomonas macrotermitis]